MGVLNIKVSGQRIKYEVAKVIFEDSDLLKARAWKWDNSRNSLYCNDNKLDIIRDYKDFDCINAGVAINERHFGMVYSLDDEKEVEQPEMWEKANPLIPYSPILMEDLQEAYKRAAANPGEMRNFKIKRTHI